jgi:hypothetical protein
MAFDLTQIRKALRVVDGSWAPFWGVNEVVKK